MSEYRQGARRCPYCGSRIDFEDGRPICDCEEWLLGEDELQDYPRPFRSEEDKERSL